MGIINKTKALSALTGMDCMNVSGQAGGTEEYIQYYQQAAQKIDTALDKLFSVENAEKFISALIQVQTEFKSTETSLKAFLGSTERTKDFMRELQDYSFNNIFEFNDLAEQATKLLAFGHASGEVIGIIDRLSGVAAGANVSLGKLTDMYNSAQAQGSLFARDIQQWQAAGVPLIQELSRQFRMTEEAIWNMANAGQIGFSELEYVMNTLTSSGGVFADAMSDKMDVFGGTLSVLKDSLSTIFEELGGSSQAPLKEGAQALDTLARNYDSAGKAIVEVIGRHTYGAYRAAVAVMNVIQAEQAAINAMVVASNNSLSTSTAYQLIWTERLTEAKALLNATMLANPYVMLTALVVGLVSAVWALSDSTTAQEKAQRKLNEELKKLAKQKEELLSDSDRLLSVMNDETKSVYSQLKAYKELVRLFPELQGMSFDEFKSMPQGDQKKRFGEILDQKELDDTVKLYEDARNRIEQINNQIAAHIQLPIRDTSWLLMFNKLNYEQEQAEQLAKGFKNEVEQIKQLQWEANTPVEERVRYYEELKKQLEEERDALMQQVQPMQELSEAADNFSLAWETGKTIIESIELNRLVTQIDEYTGKISSLNASMEEGKTETQQPDESSTSSRKEDGRLQAIEALNEKIKESEVKLNAARIAILQEGKDKRVLLADQEYKQMLALIEKERSEYEKKAGEAGVDPEQSVMDTFTERESLAEQKRNSDVLAIAKEYADQLQVIRDEVDSNFNTQLENQLKQLDKNYTERIAKAKAAGEEEEGEFIQHLQRMYEAQKERAVTKDAISKVDFNEKLDLAEHENKNKSTYFQEDAEKKKLQIMQEYAEKRMALLLELGDEESLQQAALLQKQIDGYDKALSRPSNKSIKTQVDDKGILALQQHFIRLGATEDEAKEKAVDFAEQFTNKMKMTSEVVDLLKGAFGGVSDEMDAALEAVGNIAKGFAEGGLIGGISAAAGQLMSVVGNLFTAKREIDESLKKEYESYMTAINRLISTQIGLVNQLGGMAFGENIVKTTQDIYSSIAASRTLFEEAMRAGSSWKSHSDGYNANKMLKGYQKELWELGIYTNDLNKMTDEQLVSLRQLPVVYAKLPEDIRKYIDAIADGFDKLEEFNQEVKDTVLGLDFTSIADMIVSAVTDPSIDNALEELEKNIDSTIASIVANMLRRNMLLEPIEKMVADLYNSMKTGKEDANGNPVYDLSESAARNFKNGVLNLGQQFQDAWSVLEEAFGSAGIDLMYKDPEKEEVSDTTNDNTLKGAYAKASQESIDLLAGQTGAQRVAIENIRDAMGSIMEIQVRGWGEVSVIRELSERMEDNTRQIVYNTGEMQRISGEISEQTQKTARSLYTIENHGVKAKIDI